MLLRSGLSTLSPVFQTVLLGEKNEHKTELRLSYKKNGVTLKVLVASFFTLFVRSDTAVHVCPILWEGGVFFVCCYSPVGQRAVISQAAVNIRTDSHPFSRWQHHQHHVVHSQLVHARGVNEGLELPS